MWIAMNRAFVSAVENTGDRNGVVVRARARDHLEYVLDLLEFAGTEEVVEIFETIDADYRFRIFISKESWAAVLTAYIFRDLIYPNFKNSVRDSRYHTLLSRVWGTMYELQQNADGTAFEDPRQQSIFPDRDPIESLDRRIRLEEFYGLEAPDRDDCAHVFVEIRSGGCFCRECGEPVESAVE
jgi:hypothetical protein